MTQQSELNLQGIDFEEGYIAVIDKPLEWTSSVSYTHLTLPTICSV